MKKSSCLPPLPIPTPGRRSVGHTTAVSRKPAGFNIWPLHTRFEIREDGYIVATYKSTKVEKVVLEQPVAKIDDRTAYKKLPTCTKTAELRYVVNILYEIKCN
jgi:hypothetical protein